MNYVNVFVLALSLTLITSFKFDGRITRGQNVYYDRFSYVVSLEIQSGFLDIFSYYYCVGTILSENWILTAAICTDKMYSITIYLGTPFYNIGPTKIKVKQNSIFVHPEFKSETLANDISLIWVPKITFSDVIKPIKLPTVSYRYPDYTGEEATICGWGATNAVTSYMSVFLQFGKVNISSDDECEIYKYIYTKGHICVSTFAKKTSICMGDSGGPLVINATTNPVQIGLATYGSKYCELGHPIVFTRITHYMSWIREVTKITYVFE